MQNMPIAIFRGDDTDALGYQTIVGTIKTDLDLTGCKAVFRYLSFSAEFDPIPEDKKLTVIIPSSETSKFPPGLGYASLRVYDAEGKLCTFSNRIMVFVATKTPMFGNAEFEVDFNVRPELEPLKIFVGPNPDDFDEYRGFLEKVIDRASAENYGLAMLLDAIDSDLGADDGVAATPVAVKAAYAAIIKKLTDDYYTREETDEAIDRVAAYYITYDAAGNPFPTYAALANATTVYSGGQVRVPTRNDYCVVLADETHQGAEYRYIYAVAEGQTTGSWQPQFPVEGVMTVDQSVTKDSQNPVASSGVWSAIWGALTALPGFSSIYDWCVSQLAAKLDADSGTMTGTFNLNGRLNVNYSGGTAYEIDYYGIRVHVNGETKQIYMPSSIPYADSGYMALVENLAPGFSTSATYYKDDLVKYNGTLYMCMATSHTGAWSNSDFAMASVQGALARKLGHEGPWVNGYIDVLERVTGESVPYGVRIYRDKIVYGAFTNTVPRGFTPIRTFNLPTSGGTLALQEDIPILGISVNGTLQPATNKVVDIPVPVASTSTPNPDGTGSPGSASFGFSCGNHVHPSDSTKLDKSGGGVAKIEWVNSGQSNATLLITFANGKALAFDYDGYSSDTVATRLWIAAQGFVNRLTSYFTAGNLAQLTQDGGIEDAGWTAGDLARYALTTKTISNNAVTLDDRAINAVAVSSSLASLTVNFPTATSGKARDFGLRLTVASGITTAPELALPQGVTCENADGAAPEIGADGAATILYFTETASGVFLVKGEVVTAIS